MKHSFQKGLTVTFGLVLMLCLSAMFVSAQTKRMKDAERHAKAAARVFDQVMAVRDRSIPKELLDRAEAIAVFPGVVKAAFIIGGHGGQGVISRRIKGGWSAPAFFNLGGGSLGLQIGAQKTDYVLLIMNEDGLKGLMEDKFEMGGEVSVAAGPVGRTAAATTNATLDAGILSYSRSKGAFIGAALKGGVINPDNNLNEAVYGGRKASEVLNDPKLNRVLPYDRYGDPGSAPQDGAVIEMPAVLGIFPATLSRYSRR